MPLVKAGDKVAKGQLLTDGSADLYDLFTYAGREITQEYIVNEVNKVYELQGAAVNRKHLEVIIRQMFSRKRIKTPGGTGFTQGDVVENYIFSVENIRMREEGGEEAKAESVVLGITEASLSTQSWLSSASFQNTTRVLINAAVRGTVDVLRGLKENVIIGRLIPAGTNFEDSEKIKKDTKK
jgi:DNA-directed RNA polymerase subunit beta'